MDQRFYSPAGPNQFDRLQINLERLYDQFPVSARGDSRVNPVPWAASGFQRWCYRNPFLSLSFRGRLNHLLRRTHLDLSWFEGFKDYWGAVLGGRPLWSVQDFYFLMNHYRVRFQTNQVPDTEDPEVHLLAWQRPEIIFQLFHLAYKESLHHELHQLTRLYRFKKNYGTLLEFGCATAPITTSLFCFFRPRPEVRIYLADIKTLAFHYAAYKFRACSQVIPVLLNPETRFHLSLPEPVDVIFCLNVFEHLLDPLGMVEQFYDLLPPGGLLFFDYIRSDGKNLDTRQGATQRTQVLEFIKKHFRVLDGDPRPESSTGLTVVAKPERLSRRGQAVSREGPTLP